MKLFYIIYYGVSWCSGWSTHLWLEDFDFNYGCYSVYGASASVNWHHGLSTHPRNLWNGRASFFIDCCSQLVELSCKGRADGSLQRNGSAASVAQRSRISGSKVDFLSNSLNKHWYNDVRTNEMNILNGSHAGSWLCNTMTACFASFLPGATKLVC